MFQIIPPPARYRRKQTTTFRKLYRTNAPTQPLPYRAFPFSYLNIPKRWGYSKAKFLIAYLHKQTTRRINDPSPKNSAIAIPKHRI